MGRLAAFIARQHADGAVSRRPAEVLGLGIDEGTALVIGPAGIGHHLLRQGDRGSVHILRRTRRIRRAPAHRFLSRHRGHAPGASEEDQFDFATWTGTGARFTLERRRAAAHYRYIPAAPYSTPR